LRIAYPLPSMVRKVQSFAPDSGLVPRKRIRGEPLPMNDCRTASIALLPTGVPVTLQVPPLFCASQASGWVTTNTVGTPFGMRSSVWYPVAPGTVSSVQVPLVRDAMRIAPGAW
jgi:hypothetical protein